MYHLSPTLTLLVLALRTLTWDTSPDPAVNHYVFYSLHLRPVFAPCSDTDPTPCLQNYQTISQDAQQVEVPCVAPPGAPGPLPEGTCALQTDTFPLELRDIQFFRLSACRGCCPECCSDTAFSP